MSNPSLTCANLVVNLDISAQQYSFIMCACNFSFSLYSSHKRHLIGIRKAQWKRLKAWSLSTTKKSNNTKSLIFHSMPFIADCTGRGVTNWWQLLTQYNFCNSRFIVSVSVSVSSRRNCFVRALSENWALLN